MQEIALLLLAMALGATVTLIVSRYSQDASRSMQDFSGDLARLSLDRLTSAEKESARDLRLAELTATIEKLDTTVGNLFLMVRQQNRTVLDRPMQVGEVPPGGPGVVQTRTQRPLPPEGMESEPGSTPAAAQARARAFAEPT